MAGVLAVLGGLTAMVLVAEAARAVGEWARRRVGR